MKLSLHLSFVTVFLLFTSWTMGSDTITLCSHYLGAGRFQYELNLCADPWIKQYDQVELVAFSNASYVIPVSGFSNDLDRAWWTSPLPSQGSLPVAHPQTFTFEAGSTSTSYRLGKVTVAFAFSHQDQLVSPFLSANIVGYAIIDALVPCIPNSADGSPDNWMSPLPRMHADITLKELVMVSNRVYGLSFHYPGQSTMIIQGSPDFHNWTNISYALGDSGSTTWTSPVPIDPLGPYYRVLLFSTVKRPELIGKSVDLTKDSALTTTTLQSKSAPQYWIFRSGQRKPVILNKLK